MNRYVIAVDSSPEDLEPIGLALHELLNKLPITARSVHRPGIRIENGYVVDRNYTGPVLEDAIRENRLLKTTPGTGAYKGVPVVVAPIRDLSGEVLGAIGVVDITGIFDLATLMEHQSEILRQVCGKDPCPLPTEQSMSKR